MRTFWIVLACVILVISWLLHKPIPKRAQVARDFTDTEIAYLEQSFNYAMDRLAAGEHLDWTVTGVNGRISAGKKYVSSQKAECRNYVEIARSHDAQKVASGVACKRSGAEGWCRVYGQNPQSCALETAESSVKKRARFAILQGSQLIDDLLGKAVERDTEGLTPKPPHISTGDSSMPEAPDISAPEIEPGDFRPPLPWDGK